MSIFKPMWGKREDLNNLQKTNGNLYFCKDDASVHIDYIDDNGVMQRSPITAENAYTLAGAVLSTSLNPSNNEIPTSLAVLNEIEALGIEDDHTHEISDIEGLQRKLDELTPPPDIETSDDVIIRINQLSLTMNDMQNTISDLTNMVSILTPSVGEIYITTSSENPSIKFGGSWEQVKDVFLLAAGDKYMAGSSGGEAEHVLTIDEIPAHTHTYKRQEFNRNDSDPTTGEMVYGVTNKTMNAHEGNTGTTGVGQAHNNMPPYLTVYIWRRIS